MCAGSIPTALAYFVYHHPLVNLVIDSRPWFCGLSATVYFIANAGTIATVISLTEHRTLNRILIDCYFWSFPYYLVGAGIAGGIAWLNRSFNWETSLLVLPAVYLIYRSYRLYLGKLEDEKRHVEEMANLHLRTIEALALAIEAKDHTTHEHLQRVRVYAIEVAKELGVSGPELEALHAAALLHDIGKLAVPEHIISKPGRLSPEEFEKMKIHTLVGAEILERVRFPYPVVPIVRAHHEKWDGSGYPMGLKGAEIPIGARILSAVDYLDALASDRQYRRALPLKDVMQKLATESGKSFDPKVVDVLQKRYQHLERLAVAKSAEDPNAPLSTAIKIERGLEPAAGFENAVAEDYAGRETTFLSSIAAARQEAQALFELSQDLGASLSLGETLSVFSVKLKPMVPYDAIAIYIKRDDETGSRIRERRQLPSLFIAAHSGRPGTVGLGGAQSQAHHQRESVGRTRISERSVEIQHSALGAGRASRGCRRNHRRSSSLSWRTRRLHLRSPAHPACSQRQNGALD